MPRECVKCQEIIPTKLYEGDKTYSLRNRKYCLACSPFKAGIKDGESVKNKRVYTERQKEIVKLSLYKRALTRKTELIQEHGGCCQKCGYNKSRRALTFHHLDPTLKNFGMSLDNLWSKSLDLIKEESAKCVLLCMNCHAETEDEIKKQDKTSLTQKVNDKYGTDF